MVSQPLFLLAFPRICPYIGNFIAGGVRFAGTFFCF